MFCVLAKWIREYKRTAETTTTNIPTPNMDMTMIFFLMPMFSPAKCFIGSNITTASKIMLIAAAIQPCADFGFVVVTDLSKSLAFFISLKINLIYYPISASDFKIILFKSVKYPLGSTVVFPLTESVIYKMILKFT